MFGRHKRLLVQRIRELSRPIAPIPAAVQAVIRPIPGLRAILFDFYGTLFMSATGEAGILSSEHQQDALTEALAASGFSCADGAAARAGRLIREIIAACHSRRREEGIEHPEVDIRRVWHEALACLLRERLIRGRLARKAASRISVEYEFRASPAWPTPGLKDILKRLQDRYVLGIVSNAQFYTPLLFPAFLGAGHRKLGFRREYCLWSYRHLVAKPSPALLARALDALRRRRGILPPQVLYVGNDMLNDIRVGALLGTRTALYAGERRSSNLAQDDEHIRGIRPDLILSSLEQLTCLQM